MKKAPILFLISNFLCGGYFVKIVLVLIEAEPGNNSVYWEPWNWDQLFAAIIFLMGGFIISDLLTLMYKRCGCFNHSNHAHYENMESYENYIYDSDDDISDDDDSVVV